MSDSTDKQGQRDEILAALDAVIAARRGADPEASYVAGLLRDGPERIGRKLGEEAVESLIAGLTESREALVDEIADLWFHSLVLLAARDADSSEVLAVLRERFGLSGVEEKRRRKESD
jgi:phosphoribosyl-ATP pyrophosphohydrolase